MGKYEEQRAKIIQSQSRKVKAMQQRASVILKKRNAIVNSLDAQYCQLQKNIERETMRTYDLIHALAKKLKIKER